MPDVGGVKFPYTKEGIAKAKAWSQMTGDPIKMEKKGKGGGIPIDQYSKKMSSKYKKGGQLKPVDADKNPGLAKLPEEVRNKMGYMKGGGKISPAILLRLMFALGGVIPDGRRMYSMGGKKKPRKK